MAERVAKRKEFREIGVSEGLEGAKLNDFVDEELKIWQDYLDKQFELEKLRFKEAEKNREFEIEKMKIQMEEQERVREHERALKSSSPLSNDEGSLGQSIASSLSSSAYSSTHFPLDPYNESAESIDTYLDRFERIAAQHELPKDKFVSRLLPVLRGQAYEVYSKLPADQIGDYDVLRNALLIRYDLTAEGYRRKFRSQKKEKGETYTQFASRLQKYFQK